ncbi:MAG: hypothetical protein WAW31_07395, partial [Smithella sp.]
LIYDNLSTAVEKVLRGRDRIEQESFGKFKAYYSFEARFCNPDSGHEKGGVEGLVGFSRRNYMVPVPEAAVDYNAFLTYYYRFIDRRAPVFCRVYRKHFSFRGVFYQDQITGGRVQGIFCFAGMLCFSGNGRCACA